jgi:hypothetical protein
MVVERQARFSCRAIQLFGIHFGRGLTSRSALCGAPYEKIRSTGNGDLSFRDSSGMRRRGHIGDTQFYIVDLDVANANANATDANAADADAANAADTNVRTGHRCTDL